MSDVLKPIDIVYTARHATLQAENMRHTADELECSAKNQRIRATELAVEGFEYANSHLVAAWQSGEFSDQELLRAQLELSEIDPHVIRRDSDPTSEESLARFTMLVPGEYVLGLGSFYFKDRYATGIIDQPPTNFRIMPGVYGDAGSKPSIANNYGTPWAAFDITVNSHNDAGEIDSYTFELDSGTMRLGMIGREAIAHTIGQADFTTSYDFYVVNQPFAGMLYTELANLRAQINMLYDLGMDEINTENIDRSIANIESSGFYKASQKPSRRAFRLFPGRKYDFPF